MEAEPLDREALVLEHLEFVRRVACRYAGCGLPLEDLVSEGNLGLLRAAELFDPAFGTPFEVYARLWIAQRMHRAIVAQSHAVRVPMWRSERLRRLDRLHLDLNAELGCDEAFSALGERLGFDEESLARIEQDRVVVEGGEAAMELFDERHEHPLERMSKEELRDEIVACLADLTDDELRVVMRKFGLDGRDAQSFREMAPALGRSREWVRRIGERAMARLRESFAPLSQVPREIVARRKEAVVRRCRQLGAAAKLSLWKLGLLGEMESIHLFLCF